MNKKRIISYLMLLMVVTTLMSMLTGCTTSEKKSISSVENDVYIKNEDSIIADDIKENLTQTLVELESKTEVEFSVMSVESLLDRNIEEYANTIFNTLDIGDNGVLLLFSRSDKKVRLEFGRGLEEYLNDSICDRILDTYFVPYCCETNEYAKAIEMTETAVLTVISGEYKIDIQGLESNQSVEEKKSDLALTEFKARLLFSTIAIIIAIVGMIVILIRNAESKGNA